MKDSDIKFIHQAIQEQFPEPAQRMAVALGMLTVAASEMVGDSAAEKLVAGIESQLRSAIAPWENN